MLTEAEVTLLLRLIGWEIEREGKFKEREAVRDVRNFYGLIELRHKLLRVLPRAARERALAAARAELATIETPLRF